MKKIIVANKFKFFSDCPLNLSYPYILNICWRFVLPKAVLTLTAAGWQFALTVATWKSMTPVLDVFCSILSDIIQGKKLCTQENPKPKMSSAAKLLTYIFSQLHRGSCKKTSNNCTNPSYFLCSSWLTRSADMAISLQGTCHSCVVHWPILTQVKFDQGIAV